MEDLLQELKDTERVLSEAMQVHVRVVTTAERLDAIALSQSEGLRAAAKAIKLLTTKKTPLTKDEEQQVANSYDTVKHSFNTGPRIRDELRGQLAEHADASRIFELTG